MDFENVTVEIDGAIAVATLNRPQQLNSLSYDLVKDLSLAMQALDEDEAIRVIILTGGEKVFAAGADIKEMAELGPFDERVEALEAVSVAREGRRRCVGCNLTFSR
jgi:enoyl-CoA hydratase/carnithine racemase